MHIDWSTYKITLLLYLGILLFPIGFYFSYSTFSEIQKDTQVLNTLSHTSNSILPIDRNDIQKDKIIKNNDKVFKDLRVWMIDNDSKIFYVGEEPLLKKYDALVSCWNDSKNSRDTNSIQCYKKSKSLIFSLENMLKLKQNRVYNIFYINLFIAMAIFVSLIFLIRAYIYQQLKKHAIYDLKTNLHSKDYMLATLKEVISKANRNKEVLSLMYMDVRELKKMKNNSQRDKVLEEIGSALLGSLRISDIACRYGENEFIIILPNTKEEHFKLLSGRIKNSLAEVDCKIQAIEHQMDEDSDDFLSRVHK